MNPMSMTILSCSLSNLQQSMAQFHFTMKAFILFFFFFFDYENPFTDQIENQLSTLIYLSLSLPPSLPDLCNPSSQL